MDSTKPGIAASAFSGVRWSYVGSLASIVCSLTIGAILARILGPRPFGQAIIASIVYGFVNMFVDGGFSQALIQQDELTTLVVRRTFTCQVTIGALSTVSVIALAPWIARLFHDATATQVIQAMSLVIVIQSVGLVSAAILRREMRFKTIQYANLMSYLGGYLVCGIPLALHGAGVWSLVAAYLCQGLISTLFLYCSVLHPVSPSFRLPPRAIATFGGTAIANNILNWGHSNLDNLAASHLGPSALGIYGRASNLAYQPCTAMVNGLQSVLLSATSRAQNRRPLLREVTLSLLAIVMGLLGPAYATFVLIPDTTIVGLYGTKWIEAIPLLIPMAMAMPLYGCLSLMGPVLYGMGKPGSEFWPQAISCVFAGVAYFTAARWSLLAVAWALLAVMMLRFILIVAATLILLRAPWIKLASTMCRRIVFSAVFACAIWSVDTILQKLQINAGSRLIIDVTAAAALLAGCIWIVSDVVFGADAVRFLLAYETHIPAALIRQFRRRVTMTATAEVM